MTTTLSGPPARPWQPHPLHGLLAQYGFYTKQRILDCDPFFVSINR